MGIGDWVLGRAYQHPPWNRIPQKEADVIGAEYCFWREKVGTGVPGLRKKSVLGYWVKGNLY